MLVSMPVEVPIKPPGRGRYDRAASASERAQEARSEILAAVRALALEKGEHLSVSDVTTHAGIGRNTFYGHFTHLSEAVREAGQRAFSELTAHDVEWVQGDDTPRNALEKFVGAWFQRVERDGATYRVANHAVEDQLRRWLSARLMDVHAVGARAGLFRQSLERPRLVAALGLLSALSDDLAAGNQASRECELVATDVLVVLFR